MASRSELLKSIYETAETLNDDELAVVSVICKRLDLGAVNYGRLHIDRDARDWKDEAHAEAVDLAVYLSIATLKRSRDIK